ncbi:hypothetical protein PV08_04603 [Exophiala spinifera]|uniref:F-box domain-containing protein n=1 Tax=Exophiala spinifera TaxID=91928 RepID=A0A0D2C145_9EURO|nr:uncharacterized protein PV08_04603 [Exophiala spinifera]KIW17409.1 hypothetical protein PV08_04603 [Exophiala spinifera]
MGIFRRHSEKDDPEDVSPPSSEHLIMAIEQEAPLLHLPSEILHTVCCFLPYQSLVSLSRTCQQLRAIALKDSLWESILRSHIPPEDFPRDPYPSPSYRELFITHHPYWFIPKSKIWISDDPHTGKVMIARYDPRRGCIEGYRLLADRNPSVGMLWLFKPSVVIHNFNPKVHLWVDDPVIKIPHGLVPINARQGWLKTEIRMMVGPERRHTSASLSLCRDIPERLQDKSMSLWPPRTIPNMPRVRAESVDNFKGSGHKPQAWDEISQTTFRLRHWSQFSIGMSQYGVRVGEQVSTWTTLDPSLYTPTADKPYQGIFVGDYAGHGCEFLLVMQTEKSRGSDPPKKPHPLSIKQTTQHDSEDGSGDDGDESWEDLGQPEAASSGTEWKDHDIHQGAIEAVKLTGDPNVPRGEYTFIADDIGPAGLIRIAIEPPFPGARVVRSRGHVAARGFVNDEFIPSQLIMINFNRLAQYWEPFGHISFYERVDIDRLMDDTFRPRRQDQSDYIATVKC